MRLRMISIDRSIPARSTVLALRRLRLEHDGEAALEVEAERRRAEDRQRERRRRARQDGNQGEEVPAHARERPSGLCLAGVLLSGGDRLGGLVRLGGLARRLGDLVGAASISAGSGSSAGTIWAIARLETSISMSSEISSETRSSMHLDDVAVDAARGDDLVTGLQRFDHLVSGGSPAGAAAG